MSVAATDIKDQAAGLSRSECWGGGSPSDYRLRFRIQASLIPAFFNCIAASRCAVAM
jgi:hypothetical protein